MIHFHQVSKRYGHQSALNNISFSIPKGEMVFLTGHSGAGKSTLLKLIALLEAPSSGDILLSGKNLNRIRLAQVPEIRKHIGIIFQNPHLLKNRSIYENIALPLVIQGFRYKEMAKRVRAALDKVGLIDKQDALPETLSAGEQQRIGIARAIVHTPPLILADEPTGNLDPELSEEIMKLFIDFNQLGTTLLIASHDIALVTRLGHRRLKLHQGQLEGDDVEI